MEAFEAVLEIREGIENFLVIKTLCKCKMVRIACHRVKVAERFVHAAVFDVEHSLVLFVGEVVEVALCPVCHFRDDFEGLGVIAVFVHVQKARVDFVEGVPGRPPVACAVNDAFDALLRECA